MKEENRITLQYSVEEGHLKFEVQRLICNALSRLTSIECDEPAANTILSMTTVDEIAELRIELSKISILLGDASIIVENYVDYKHQQKMQRAVGSDEVAPEAPDFEGIQDRIQNFKDKLSVHENTD